MATVLVKRSIYNNYRINNYLSPLDYQHDNLTIQLLTRYLQYNVITGVTYKDTNTVVIFVAYYLGL